MSIDALHDPARYASPQSVAPAYDPVDASLVSKAAGTDHPKGNEPSKAPQDSHGGPLTDKEIDDTAKDILGVGRKVGQDDYSKRLESLARTCTDLSPEDRGRLINQIFEHDHNATGSWLNADVVREAYNEKHRISEDERNQLMQGFAVGYEKNTQDGFTNFNSGRPWEFFGFPTNSRGDEGFPMDPSSLKQFYGDMTETLHTGTGEQKADYAGFLRKVAHDQFTAGMIHSDKVDDLHRGTFASLLVNATQATKDIGDGSGNPVGDLMLGLDREPARDMLGVLSKADEGQTGDLSKWYQDYMAPGKQDKGLRDGMSLAIEGYANAKYDTGRDDDLLSTVLDGSKWSHDENEYFAKDNVPKSERRDALNALMVKHGNDLLVDSTRLQPGENGGDAKEILDRRSLQYTNLLRASTLVPGYDGSKKAMTSIGDGVADDAQAYKDGKIDKNDLARAYGIRSAMLDGAVKTADFDRLADLNYDKAQLKNLLESLFGIGKSVFTGDLVGIFDGLSGVGGAQSKARVPGTGSGGGSSPSGGTPGDRVADKFLGYFGSALDNSGLDKAEAKALVTKAVDDAAPDDDEGWGSVDAGAIADKIFESVSDKIVGSLDGGADNKRKQAYVKGMGDMAVDINGRIIAGQYAQATGDDDLLGNEIYTKTLRDYIGYVEDGFRDQNPDADLDFDA